MEDRIQIGIISSTHGIKGEVKIFPTTDDVKRFKDLKKVILDTGKEQLELEIQSVKFFKQFAILKFVGIDDINDVEKYKGKSLLVTRENAVKLNKNEFFVADLIGLNVIEEDGKYLGILESVIETGANDVYVVNMGEGKEVLLPAIRDCILDVNIKEKTMKVHVMDGLLDD